MESSPPESKTTAFWWAKSSEWGMFRLLLSGQNVVMKYKPCK
ncbi:hypothetical protein [Moraxella lacunata]